MPHSWTPLTCPGKTPVRRLQVVCLVERLSAWPEPVQQFSVQTWGGLLRWTAPVTDTQQSLGCCNVRWWLGLCALFLYRGTELERRLDHSYGLILLLFNDTVRPVWCELMWNHGCGRETREALTTSIFSQKASTLIIRKRTHSKNHIYTLGEHTHSQTEQTL